MDLALEYGSSIENHTAGTFQDECKLPAPKLEIIYALLYAIANAPNTQLADAFAVALFTLSDFQEGVGDNPLGIFANGHVDAANMSPEEMTAWAKSIPFDRIRYFNELMKSDLERMNKALAAAKVANVLLVPWHVKLWHRLSGKGQFDRKYAGFVDFPD